MPRWLPLSLFAVAWAIALWRAPAVEPAIFAPSSAARSKAASQALFSEKIPEANGTVGASSLARLPDGRLVLAWQESRTDDPADANIRLITQDKQGNWGQVSAVAGRPTVAGSSFAYLSQLGSPLLYAEGNWLHLWFISHGLGDWRSAALNHSFSSDAGQTWSAQRKTAIAPAFNPGGLRLQPPLSLADGGLALPLQESTGEGAESWLRLAATGRPLDKLRLPAGQTLLPEGPRALTLPAGAQCLLPLSASKLLVAGHPQGNRQILQLWLSTDGGEHWTAGRIIEQAADGGAEFTLPFLLLAGDGQIHLTYTWRRQGIRHLRFSEDWLAEEKP